MAYALRKTLIERMPEMIERMGKPIEKVDSIRVVQMGGLTGGQGNAEAGQLGTNAPTGHLATDLTQSMLSYRMQIPVVDQLARELGMDLSRGFNGLIETAAAPLDENIVTGGDTVASAQPTSSPRLTKAQQAAAARAAEAEVADLKRLAGIHDDDAAA